MAKILSKAGISTLQIVRPWHVTQSIDAFLGTDAYDITLSGSMTITGSVLLNGLSTTSQTNVLTYNTSTGKVFYTASSAIGGGGSQTPPAGNNYEIQFNSASAFQATSSLKFNYFSQSLEQGTSVTASGISSHAEGSLTRAEGLSSHAEGFTTLASGISDHAEGYQTTASSIGWPPGGGTAAAAHAEGYNTVAYGIASHAEGYATLVSASFAHAEGYGTIANGSASHAEGFLTTASGNYSHAAGYGTHATGSGVGQSVIGWFNKPVTGHGDFIIGNGTSNSSRSNLLHASGNLVAITGSLVVSGSSPTTVTFGNSLFWSNPNASLTFTGSMGVSGSMNVSGSITSNGSDIITSNQTGSFLTGSTGAFATTGSNNFNGNQTVTGSMTVTGSLTISGSDTLTNIGPFTQTGNSIFTGNITASNDISSSGNFYANRIFAGGYISTPLLTHPSTPIEVNQHLSGSSTTTASFGYFKGDGSGLTNVTSTPSAGTVSGSAQLIALGVAITGSSVLFTNITSSGNISASGNITALDLNLFGGDIDLKNAGAQSNIKFYCESSNAHYTQLQAPSHSAYSGNVITTLPAYDFDFSTPNFQANITASGDISSSGDVQGNSLTTNQYIKHNGDADTQINFLDDEIRFEAGNLLLLDLHKKGSAPHEVTVNTGGNNVDFIIKDDDSTTYFIADASTTNIGIGPGMTTPTSTLHVSGAGNVNVHVEGHITASGNISSSATIFGDTGSFSQALITNTSLDDSLLITTTENSSTAGPVIALKRNSSSPDDGDYLGQLKFKGENDADQEVVYAKITGKISDASDTTEDGMIEYTLKKAGSNVVVSRLTSTDLKLINGTGLEVNGNISTDGTSSAAYFSGDGSNLTNLQRPISNSVSTHFTASNSNSGFYFRAGGNVTCSIQSGSLVSCNIGSEFEIFQTSSAGYVLFLTGSGVTLNSKSGKTKLAGQFSAATLKKVGAEEWDLIGDLG